MLSHAASYIRKRVLTLQGYTGSADVISQASLHAVYFLDCHFRSGTIEGTDFSRARFVRCTFDDVDLKNVNLSSLVAFEVVWYGCLLVGVSFEGAMLSHCSLLHGIALSCTFRNCALLNSTIVGVQMSRADLRFSDETDSSIRSIVYDDATTWNYGSLRPDPSKYNSDEVFRRLRRSEP
jgi:uncharacterized protein YjbI with pentapeptide repeats